MANPLKPWTKPAPPRLRLTNATLIDPKDGGVYANVTIDLKDGVVHHLTKLSQANAAQQRESESLAWTTNADIRLVDLEGRFVCPGLIDCHVHLACPPGEDGLRDTMNQHPETSLLRQPWLAGEMLKRGFTSVRDCGGATLALKEAIEEGLVSGPRLFIAGHAISQTGGHGDVRTAKEAEYQCCGGNIRGLGRVADGVEQCLHAAREELRQGADFLKIMVSGGVVSPTDKLTNLQYTPAEIQAFAKVAADSGTFVTAHAYTPASIQNAVANGVTGIEHGNLIDEPTAKLMAERGAFLTPTLITYQTMASKEFGSFLPPSIAAKNLQVLDAGLKSIQIADRAGVNMCYGTDLLGPLQIAQSGEFALRKQAGLSNLKVLQAATVNAAKMLRQEDRLGRIKEGMVADLLILDVNPLENVNILTRPEKHVLAVIQNGRVVVSRTSKLPSDQSVGGTVQLE